MTPAGGRQLVLWTLLTALALIAFHWLAYGDFTAAFFSFDDFAVLGLVDGIRLERPADLLRFLQPQYNFALYRPLTVTTYYWVQWAVWGIDPAPWMSTHLAFHVTNGVLAFACARRLLGSDAAALAAALLYASAPGHTLAARWLAYFTITGTVTACFATVALWLYGRGRWRLPATLAAFVLAIGCSEHAVTVPFVLTLVAVLGEGRRDWLRLVRELAPFYAVGGAYVAAKLVFLAVIFPRTQPIAAAVHARAYHLAFEPTVVLETIGRYLTGAIAPLLPLDPSVGGYRALGAAVLALALLTSATALRARAPRTLGLVACGLAVFVVALGPVLLLPEHVSLSYVGIAALGVALAITAAVRALPYGDALAVAVALALATYDVRTASPLARTAQDFRTIEGSSLDAVAWIATLERVADTRPDVREVLVPSNPNTRRLFGVSHRLFACTPFTVRPVDRLPREAPGRLVLPKSDPAPRGRRGWGWLIRECPRDAGPVAAASGGPSSGTPRMPSRSVVAAAAPRPARPTRGRRPRSRPRPAERAGTERQREPGERQHGAREERVPDAVYGPAITNAGRGPRAAVRGRRAAARCAARAAAPASATRTPAART